MLESGNQLVDYGQESRIRLLEENLVQGSNPEVPVNFQGAKITLWITGRNLFFGVWKMFWYIERNRA